MTVDTAAPTAPAITSFSPDSSTVGDGITNATVLTLTGTAEANSTVNVSTKQLGTTTANGSGAATHSFTATDTDAAGNTSATSAVLNVTVDTLAPNTLVIASDAIVNTNEVMLTGSAETNSVVNVFDGAIHLGTATANGSGAWSFATAQLADGTHSFTTKVTDAAGNTSAASAALSVTVDTQAPSAPAIAAFSPDSNVVGDGVTNATC